MRLKLELSCLEETSEAVSGLVVTEARRSGLLPAERRFAGAKHHSGVPPRKCSLSDPSLQSSKFLLESKSHFICSVLKKENKDQVFLPLCPETLYVPTQLGQHPNLAGLPPLLTRSGRTGPECPVG